jgi:hypothetical protein
MSEHRHASSLSGEETEKSDDFSLPSHQQKRTRSDQAISDDEVIALWDQETLPFTVVEHFTTLTTVEIRSFLMERKIETLGELREQWQHLFLQTYEGK